MRKVIVVVGVALLLLAIVPLSSAAPAPAARYVAGNIKAAAVGNPDFTDMFLFEVRAAPSGALQFGYYQSAGLTGDFDPPWHVGSRTQGTVDDIRFFKTESGALAAQFGGKECVVASLATPDSPVGQCNPYALVVTDGAAIGEADTFCGGPPDDPCRYKFDVVEGDISIYGMP